MSLIKSEYILTDTAEFEYNETEENYLPGGVPTSFSEAGVNTAGSETVFNISSYNNPVKLYQSCIKMEFEIRNNANDNAALITALDSTLINNFFPYLWSSMELRINDTPIETINYPGIADTMLKLVALPLDSRQKGGEQIGWIPDENTYDAANTNSGREHRKRLYNNTGQYTVYWYLYPLFGFTEYQKVLYKIPFSLILRRQINDTQIFHTDNAEANQVGHLHIKSINWLIPYVQLETNVKTHFLKQITEHKTFDVIFKKRNIYSATVPATRGEQTINLFHLSNPPRYILIMFQSVENAYTTNNSLFNSYDITSLQLIVGTALYPRIPIRVNFHNDLTEPYDNYRKMCSKFFNHPQLSMHEFGHMYPMYCFDTSQQDEDIVRSGATVSLRISKNNNVAGTMYIVCLEDNFWKINNDNGIMSNISFHK